MRTLLLYIAPIWGFLLLSSLLQAQPNQTIKLTQLETAKTVEGTKAGQIGLTNSNGKQRYAQFVEINPDTIAYTPAPSGNTANLSEFVIAADSLLYYIDWQGRAVQIRGNGGGSSDALGTGFVNGGGSGIIPDNSYAQTEGVFNLGINPMPDGSTPGSADLAGAASHAIRLSPGSVSLFESDGTGPREILTLSNGQINASLENTAGLNNLTFAPDQTYVTGLSASGLLSYTINAGLSGIDIQFNDNEVTYSGGQLIIAGGQASIISRDYTGGTESRLSVGDRYVFVTGDGPIFAGIRYQSDVSANQSSDRFLPDKGTVKALISNFNFPAQLDDATAQNGQIYYSTDQNALTYKDPSGTVHPLY